MKLLKKLGMQGLAGILLIAGNLSLVFWYNYTSTNLLSSDMSSELILAKLLSIDGGWLSTKWIYSTELRIINSQIVTSFLFKFFNDWSLVRALGNLIMLSGMTLSGFYLLKQVGVPCRNRLLPLAFISLPFSDYQCLIILVGGYYIPHIIISFMVIAFWIKIVNMNTNMFTFLFQGGYFCVYR